jgi:hypothetical protein
VPAQSNATLLAVNGAGGTDTYEGAQALGALKSAAALRAYYTERRERVRDAESTDVLVRRWLVVDTEALTTYEEADVLTFRLDGEAEERTGTVRAVERRALAGMPRDVQTTRLTLEET